MPPSLSRSRLRRSAGLLAVLSAATLLAACQPEAADGESAQQQVRAVWVVPAGPAKPPSYAFAGTVRARFDVPLAFRVGGKIAERKVDVGTRVSRGEVIARLDTTDLEATLRAEIAREKAADAEAHRAREDLTRTIALKEKGHVSQAALDDARSASDSAAQTLKAARESRVLAENQLAYGELRADADGVVTSVLAEPGEVVTVGQAVVKVARDAAREIEVAVPEARIGLLEGTSARVSLWTNPNQTFPAHLREVSPQADAAARTFNARFTVDAPVDALRLGVSATLHLTPAAADRGLSVPLSAVWYDGSQPNVWLARAGEDRVRPLPVSVLRLDADAAIVEGALAAGDLVVSMGAHRLDPDMPVRVVRHGNGGPVTVGALQ